MGSRHPLLASMLLSLASIAAAQERPGTREATASSSPLIASASSRAWTSPASEFGSGARQDLSTSASRSRVSASSPFELRHRSSPEEHLELRMPRVTPAVAFRREMDEESRRYLDTSPWAGHPLELIDDKHVREGRNDDAEHILGHALEAWADALIRPDRKPPGSVRFGLTSGIAIDETPSWTIKKRKAGSGMRLDIPMTDSALKFHAWRELSSDRGPQRIGTAFGIDPWDERAWVALSLSF